MLPWPMPETLHLYMLVAGIALGVLLCPAVLGKFAPSAYDTLFVGTGDRSELDAAEKALADYEAAADERSARLERITEQAQSIFSEGESPMIGVQEQILGLQAEFDQQRQQLILRQIEAQQPIRERRAAYDQKLGGLATLLLLLVVVGMLLEPIIAPQRKEIEQGNGKAEVPSALPRLITARYGLLAAWIVLALAKPDWLLSINPIVAIVLATVVGIAAFVPLGKTAKAGD